MVKTVGLELKVWEKIVGNLVVEYESLRDTVIVGIDDWRNEMGDIRSTVEKIQRVVGEYWYEFVVVGLNDSERKVVVENRDVNRTNIRIEGVGYPIEIRREDLEGWLRDIPEELENEGTSVFYGLTELVLYKEDVEYLLRNMNEDR